MKKVQVYNITQNSIMLQEAEVANSFFKRLKGLLLRKTLPPGEGLVIKPCKAVHTLFMFFPIDVCFVNKEGHICFVIERMRPFRLSPCIKEAVLVIEAPSGTLRKAKCETGDKLQLREL